MSKAGQGWKFDYNSRIPLVDSDGPQISKKDNGLDILALSYKKIQRCPKFALSFKYSWPEILNDNVKQSEDFKR